MFSLFNKQIRQQVLVVDSDQTTAEGVIALVSGNASNCEVDRACSGFEGLQKIENGAVNIVVAAERLVDMSGTTFINILQGIKKSKRNEPACVLMAKDRRYVDTSDIHRKTFFEVIRCPVEAAELTNALDRALDLDGLQGRIELYALIWKVLWGMVPVAVLLGVLSGL